MEPTKRFTLLDVLGKYYEGPGWSDVELDCVMMACASRSGFETKEGVKQMSELIDRYVNADVPARIAILLCEEEQKELVAAIAHRYWITAETIEADKLAVASPTTLRVDHWMRCPAVHMRPKRA